MEARDLQLASEFCKLVETRDLLEYLGVPATAPPDEAIVALKAKRRRMQSMQANPKFRDSARFLIKHHKAFERLLADPAAHLEQARREQEAKELPALELALDAILVDGGIAPAEDRFLRRRATELGISLETYQALLREKASAKGIPLPDESTPSGPPVWSGATTIHAAPSQDEPPKRKLRGATGHGWWDATFTRMLLETIPGGPGEMVDIYCRTALSALTLLPERRQLTYLGVDRSAERLETARQELERDALVDVGARITLTEGQPHALPIPDESVDYVLAIRALANQPDTVPVFAEAMRVLRPGGRMIVAEPDGLSESFYFDGHLAGYNQAFHRLCEEVDLVNGAGGGRLGRPGLALGPSLGARMEHAGLELKKVEVHASKTLKQRTFGKLARRLRGYPRALARSAGIEAGEALSEVLAAMDRLEDRIPEDQRGLGGGVLPMFLCVGIKP